MTDSLQVSVTNPLIYRHDVMLVIQSSTGGVWKFPVRFVASEPIADDTIKLEAAGLNKTSSVGIRLTSQSR